MGVAHDLNEQTSRTGANVPDTKGLRLKPEHITIKKENKMIRMITYKDHDEKKCITDIFEFNPINHIGYRGDLLQPVKTFLVDALKKVNEDSSYSIEITNVP